jgi:hypothetical protein
LATSAGKEFTGFGYEAQMAAMTKIAGARPGMNAEEIAEITEPEPQKEPVTTALG